MAMRTNYDKHGMTGTKTYICWYNMKQRCDNAKRDDYQQYGARGIKYDKRWSRFINFLEDMGECPKDHSLERLDINQNYSKENCKCIPMKDQAKNRRNTRLFNYKGKTQTIPEWCTELGLRYQTVRCRIQRGWTIQHALQLP